MQELGCWEVQQPTVLYMLGGGVGGGGQKEHFQQKMHQAGASLIIVSLVY
jgi:hypothetical protein